MTHRCMICGAGRDLAREGEVVLCRRCLEALYAALAAHFPLKPGGECDRMIPSENMSKDG